jgi:hypothetical protein
LIEISRVVFDKHASRTHALKIELTALSGKNALPAAINRCPERQMAFSLR